MSTLKRDVGTLVAHESGVGRLRDVAIYGLFTGYLLLVVLAHTTDTVLAWHLAAASIPFGAILGCRLAVDAFGTVTQSGIAAVSVVGLTLVVLAVVYQSGSPGVGVGSNRSRSMFAVLALTVAFVAVVTDIRRYSRVQWTVFGCFAVLAGIYFAHSLAFHPGSPQSRWPVWAAIVLGANLFVIPQLVPGRIFFRVVAGLAALSVVLGLLTYVVGDYTLWRLTVDQYPNSSPSVPGLDPDVLTLQSVFLNPNSLGLFAFAGLVAAVVEFHRSLLARRPIMTWVAATLAALCGLGVVLSNARAAILASAVAVGIYVAYAAGNRSTVPVAVASGLAVGVAVIVTIYLGAFGITGSGRTDLWTTSVAAIRDGPPLFGYGSGPVSAVIEAFHPDGRASSPHNAYLEVTIQTGLVGGLAYVGLTVGTILARTVDYRNVNVAALALAVGWAIHQGLESYILFEWSLGAVLAALAFGYLLADD